MLRRPNKWSTPRPFKLIHQTICITSVNFFRKSIAGYVELSIVPLKNTLNKIKLNCKQCRIHRVCINDDHESTFHLSDPTIEVSPPDVKQRDLDFYSNCHSRSVHAVDAEEANGELVIRVPNQCMFLIRDLRIVRLCIEFSLENPKGGIHFVVPEVEGTMAERSAHVFTYGSDNMSRLWFPCVDSYTELCTWKIEIAVDNTMVAIATGDLIETVHTMDMRRKTYHYVVGTPTSASNIGFAVGPFEIHVDPSMHEVTHFCLPHLMPLLKHSSSVLHQALEFYEECIGNRFPYNCYKQVFVDEAYSNSCTYSTLSIFSCNILYSPRIIDQTPISMEIMAKAVAQQFFGCFVSMQAWCDAWVVRGISGYLTGLYLKKTFGANEYKYWILEELNKLCKYEQECGGVILDWTIPPSSKDGTAGECLTEMHYTRKHQHTASHKYQRMLFCKAHLVVRLIEQRIGQESLLQVFNKLLSIATTASQQKFNSNMWGNMLVSTNDFIQLISTVSGKDMESFMDQWVHQSGCAYFTGKFSFNRKRNIVEVEIKQDANRKGTVTYVGPLQVIVQELDGSFTHTLQIDSSTSKHEVLCHSKARRLKNKRIPLKNGEEIVMDLNCIDEDTPVLWIRLDPDLMLLRQVNFLQADSNFQCQMRYERDVRAQAEAISSLETHSTPNTRASLIEVVRDKKCFYRIRTQALYCLSKVMTKYQGQGNSAAVMVDQFRKLFGSVSCPQIVKQNNFQELQSYFLQKAFPQAMASIRNVHNLCPREIVTFMLDLLKYNDNRKNKLSDNYYRASLIDSLANMVTPSATMVTSVEQLSPDTKLILEEIVRHINMEKLIPCYKYTVTVSCLRALRVLQKNGHLPSDPTLFRSYAVAGNYINVRLEALASLVDYAKVDTSLDEFSWLLDVVEKDNDHYVRYKIVRMLSKNPPFTNDDHGKDKNPLNCDTVVDRLWKLMNSGSACDSRLRCALVEVYYTLFGRARPSCMPIPEFGVVLNLKEKRAVLNPTITVPDPSSEEEEEDEEDESSQLSVGPLSSPVSGDKRTLPPSPVHEPPPPVALQSSSEPIIVSEQVDGEGAKLRFTTAKVDDEMDLLERPKTPSMPDFLSSSKSETEVDVLAVENEPSAPGTSVSAPVIPIQRTSSLSLSLSPSAGSPADSLASSSHNKHKDKKKKRKKDKHKHKHKHKHEKHDRD